VARRIVGGQVKEAAMVLGGRKAHRLGVKAQI